jgi:hypothetical protein
MNHGCTFPFPPRSPVIWRIRFAVPAMIMISTLSSSRRPEVGYHVQTADDRQGFIGRSKFPSPVSVAVAVAAAVAPAPVTML